MSLAFDWVGRRLAGYLTTVVHQHGPTPPTPRDRLERVISPGDVLLVEGSSRISTAIKYLTQSTWSHVALYVGPQPAGRLRAQNHCFVEADLVDGVRSVGFDEYEPFPTRICRPIGLSGSDIERLSEWTIAQIGRRYDLRNVVDLARYLLPTPPVLTRYRRQLIALGSGDPTRAICSTLVAQAFERIGYPVLPEIGSRPSPTQDCPQCREEVLKIRHHSLYTPRDFDVSPYFAVVKPTIETEFDFHRIVWANDGEPPAA